MQDLQLYSFPTLFSAIAALGVLAQWSFQPLIYGMVGSKISSKTKIIKVSKEETINLNLLVYNCSKITAEDIIVQVHFPPFVDVIHINSPCTNHIKNKKSEAEIAFDADQNYNNPLHPKTYNEFGIKIKINNLPGPCLVPISTIAKNMSKNVHSFILAPENISPEKEKNILDDISNSYLVKTKEKYFFYQKIITISLFLLALMPILFNYLIPFLKATI